MERETRHFDYNGLKIAYRVLSEDGPPVLFIGHWVVTGVDMFLQASPAYDFTGRLTKFCRCASYDQPGTGLSDELPADADRGMDTWIEILDGVLDQLGWPRATLLATDVIAAVACAYAARRPERVDSLILHVPVAGGLVSRDALDEAVERFTGDYGTIHYISRVMPSIAEDAEFESEWRRWQRVARPKADPRSVRTMLEIDAREALPSVRCPTLILHSREYHRIPIGAIHEVADRIPGATLVELPGRDHFPFRPDDIERWVGEVRSFLIGDATPVRLDRVLTTVLFTDIVSSTARTAEIGDKRWRDNLDRHDEIVHAMLRRFGGHLVKSTGDGVLATLDSPARAIRCAQTLRDALAGIGIEIRSGLHTGEIELRDEDVGGTAVNIARRVCDYAERAEVRVSESVVLVVAGSGLAFDDLGPHELKGVPGTWRLFRARD